MEAWGFEYKSTPPWVKDRMGTGEWLRGQTEYCLFAARDKPVFLNGKSRGLQATRREHSIKLEEFYSLVEETAQACNRELFARQTRPQWHSFGNDTERFTYETASTRRSNHQTIASDLTGPLSLPRSMSSNAWTAFLV
jgi:N6-adenosine-specific RNA methylase IME4